jgi:hypothetical protein
LNPFLQGWLFAAGLSLFIKQQIDRLQVARRVLDSIDAKTSNAEYCYQPLSTAPESSNVKAAPCWIRSAWIPAPMNEPRGRSTEPACYGRLLVPSDRKGYHDCRPLLIPFIKRKEKEMTPRQQNLWVVSGSGSLPRL